VCHLCSVICGPDYHNLFPKTFIECMCPEGSSISFFHFVELMVNRMYSDLNSEAQFYQQLLIVELLTTDGFG